MYTELYNLEFKRLDMIKQFIRIQSEFYNLTKDLQEKRQKLYIELFKAQGKVGMLKQYKDNNQILPVNTFNMLALDQDQTIESKMNEFIDMMKQANDTFNELNINEKDDVSAKQFFQMILDKIYLNEQYRDMLEEACGYYLLNDITELKNLYFDVSNVMPVKASDIKIDEKKESLLKEISFLENNYPENEEDAIYDINKLNEEKVKLNNEIDMVQNLIDQAYDILDDYESAGKA